METDSIDIWYGPHQVFHGPEGPQPWVNILGRVRSPGIRLDYALNDGPPQNAILGPDGRRLVDRGDFNIEIPYAELPRDTNTLRLTTTDGEGRTSSSTVQITIKPSAAPALPQLIDWASVPCLQKAAQVVDGLWEVEDGLARTRQVGYDRLLAVGRMDHSNYEVSVPVVIYDFNPNGKAYPGGGPGVGLLVGWQGHHDWPAHHPHLHRWWGSRMLAGLKPRSKRPRPRVGWWPMGALAWYNWRQNLGYRLALIGHGHSLLCEDLQARHLELNTKYVFKVRFESRKDKPNLYKFKVWNPQGPEPEIWDLIGTGKPGENAAGSVLLVAHHAAAGFGPVRLAPLVTDEA